MSVADIEVEVEDWMKSTNDFRTATAKEITEFLLEVALGGVETQNSKDRQLLWDDRITDDQFNIRAADRWMEYGQRLTDIWGWFKLQVEQGRDKK